MRLRGVRMTWSMKKSIGILRPHINFSNNNDYDQWLPMAIAQAGRTAWHHYWLKSYRDWRESWNMLLDAFWTFLVDIFGTFSKSHQLNSNIRTIFAPPIADSRHCNPLTLSQYPNSQRLHDFSYWSHFFDLSNIMKFLVAFLALLGPVALQVEAFSAITPPQGNNKILVLVEPSPLTYGTKESVLVRRVRWKLRHNANN